MSKTPEELAERWIKEYIGDATNFELAENSFIAGYQAAKDKYDAQIKELKANWTYCCEDKARLLQELAAKEDKS